MPRCVKKSHNLMIIDNKLFKIQRLMHFRDWANDRTKKPNYINMCNFTVSKPKSVKHIRTQKSTFYTSKFFCYTKKCKNNFRANIRFSFWCGAECAVLQSFECQSPQHHTQPWHARQQHKEQIAAAEHTQHHRESRACT